MCGRAEAQPQVEPSLFHCERTSLLYLHPQPEKIWEFGGSLYDRNEICFTSHSWLQKLSAIED